MNREVAKLFVVKEKEKKICQNAMIVEDEKDLCFLLELILKKENLNTTSVNSILEAKQSIKNIEPKVLFVDNHLPDGSGTDFIGQVRLLYPAIKIIMITAYDTPLDVQKAFNNGVDYFISKPFNASAIKNVLARFALGNTG